MTDASLDTYATVLKMVLPEARDTLLDFVQMKRIITKIEVAGRKMRVFATCARECSIWSVPHSNVSKVHLHITCPSYI